MHFSKTFAKLLLDLPPELRENAIQYRQLKKLINQVVSELNLLGLSPNVLQELLEERVREEVDREGKGKQKECIPEDIELDDEHGRSCYSHPRVVYEVNSASGTIEPRLRVWITPPSPRRLGSRSPDSNRSPSPAGSALSVTPEDDEDAYDTGAGAEETTEHTPDSRNKNMGLIWALQRRASSSSSSSAVNEQESPGGSLYTAGTSTTHSEPQEIIIPLASDTAFFQLLSTALLQISDHLLTLHGNYVETLKTLARDIGNTARPVSSGHSYRAHSILSHPGTIRSPSTTNKSDLYSWREILQLYVEAEVFENVSEAHRGEHSLEESERRLKAFAERVTQRGLSDGRELKMKQSRDALQTFLELNMFILNVKKFQNANAEAIRKILKKHAKRTSLRLPDINSSSASKDSSTFGYQERLAKMLFPDVQLSDLHDLRLDSATPNSKAVTIMGTPAVTYAFSSLPRILVQAIGETLLPVIPHIDDYACVICTNIAFKPIRLNCGHLFCVRCLVKMQKRGQGDCPMCRAPTVLVADRSNVDWALLNFMSDWFPIESRDKLKQSEKEAMEEQLLEMGVDPNQKCIIM
ncbi:hypothetical protein PQX77_017155 [Marasmius sp. AFHP31]|nr:hypothetical protein PQX77_017155 [Marasmius sp. AFHP31]